MEHISFALFIYIYKLLYCAFQHFANNLRYVSKYFVDTFKTIRHVRLGIFKQNLTDDSMKQSFDAVALDDTKAHLLVKSANLSKYYEELIKTSTP